MVFVFFVCCANWSELLAEGEASACFRSVGNNQRIIVLYAEKGMRLQSFVPEGITLNGSEQHLYQVPDVLLDNALKYSAPGAIVGVDLVRTGRTCVLSVTSPGEPISKEDLKSIFKRFYRADKASAMNGSYGLGLSFAESVVASHGGKIWAESGDDYNKFFVQLSVKDM